MSLHALIFYAKPAPFLPTVHAMSGKEKVTGELL
jgi:hypothetical protein